MSERAKKAEQRKKLLGVRNALQDKEKMSEDLCAHIRAHPAFIRAQCVLFYAPIGSEPDVRGAMEAAFELGKEVYLPRCVQGDLEIARVESLRDCVPGMLNVLEPIGPAADPMALDLVLCPGVGFDRQFGRIGYGKGYFDRFSKKTRAFFLGVCYTACIVDALPLDPWDSPMDGLVTERGAFVRRG